MKTHKFFQLSLAISLFAIFMVFSNTKTAKADFWSYDFSYDSYYGDCCFSYYSSYYPVYVDYYYPSYTSTYYGGYYGGGNYQYKYRTYDYDRYMNISNRYGYNNASSYGSDHSGERHRGH
jgi:hypothetical protein